MNIKADLTYISVALDIPKGPFVYGVEHEYQAACVPGVRVRVPFRDTTMIGIVTEQGACPPQKGLKKIESVLDAEPVMSATMLALTRWMAEYYYCSWGEAIANALPALLRRGRPIKTDISLPTLPDVVLKHTLTPDQRDVFTKVEEAIISVRESAFLLQGVTGSGKTEVYLHLIRRTLMQQRTVIVIVPEIALTVHLMNYFNSYFGEALEVLHSKMTDAERFNAWCRIKSGHKRVVLGARSALFSPLDDIGLIIIDEEHENSLKQNDTPRYHARTVAEELAKLSKAVLLMGTATPSLEARYACEEGRYVLLKLNSRIVNNVMPKVDVIDLRNEMSRGGNLLISRPLRIAIEQTLVKKESIILFLNRRGYATFVVCMDCGEVVMCKSCKVSLTYHAAAGKLVCHYCNYRIDPIDTCPACKSKNVKFGGMGTEKIQFHV
ncbi:MAG: primosomal protein N', partial [Candidatus Omnitrophica bacterium]|nr:primosomal protein N' [Candidatus Omnitrophota bacterium]